MRNREPKNEQKKRAKLYIKPLKKFLSILKILNTVSTIRESEESIDARKRDTSKYKRAATQTAAGL